MSGIQSIAVSAAQSYASVGTQAQQSLQPFSNLNLTEAQRVQLRSVFSSAKQNGTSQADVQKQVSAVLTPAQQQTLSGDLKAGAGRSGHHHHHASDSSPTLASSSPSASTSSSTPSPVSTILDAVTNVQNQAAAAKSTLVGTLQDQVLATNDNTATA
jgi:hypothetical protein